jgi:GNAT superfamily N-acetyltransferase
LIKVFTLIIYDLRNSKERTSMMSWKTGPGLSKPQQVPQISDEELLCGPGGDPDLVHIWDGFAKTFETSLQELAESVGRSDWGTGPMIQQVTSPLRTWIAETLSSQPSILETTGQDEVRIVPVPGPDGTEIGLAALMRTPNDDERIVGLLLRPDLSVERFYRGFGIGRALIAAELLATGGIPTWEHDKPGYSPAGAATVRAGVDLARTLAPVPEEIPSP